MFMKIPTTLYLQRYILEQMGEEDVGGSQLTQDAVMQLMLLCVDSEYVL